MFSRTVNNLKKYLIISYGSAKSKASNRVINETINNT